MSLVLILARLIYKFLACSWFRGSHAPGELKSCHLAAVTNFRFKEKPYLKGVSDSSDSRTPDILLWPPHKCAQACTSAHTQRYTQIPPMYHTDTPRHRNTSHTPILPHSTAIHTDTLRYPTHIYITHTYIYTSQPLALHIYTDIYHTYRHHNTYIHHTHTDTSSHTEIPTHRDTLSHTVTSLPQYHTHIEIHHQSPPPRNTHTYTHSPYTH